MDKHFHSLFKKYSYVIKVYFNVIASKLFSIIPVNNYFSTWIISIFAKVLNYKNLEEFKSFLAHYFENEYLLVILLHNLITLKEIAKSK